MRCRLSDANNIEKHHEYVSGKIQSKFLDERLSEETISDSSGIPEIIEVWRIVYHVHHVYHSKSVHPVLDGLMPYYFIARTV